MSNTSVILPGDTRYSTLVRGFNLRWVGNPKRIVACDSPARVVSALQDALDDGLRVTVRGGGHCYENFVSGNDGGVILDLSPMNQSGRDPVTGWYFIDGGATLWNVYHRLFVEHGVTLPGGSCASVGAGGHITGGGYGLLSRLHGLTVDWLHAVDVVVVDRAGRVRTVRATRDDS
ncbi:MAG TPA: FAD-binding protein, partial [Thermomicrobiales bacterium]|nr:FAD-binding protein [Thermomicrobiales bacterium]